MQLIPRALRELGLTPELPPGPPFFRFADPSEFERSLRSAGLAPGPSELVRWTVEFDSPAAFLRMFEEGSARTRAGIRALSPRDRSRLFRRLEGDLERFRSGETLRLPTAAVIGLAHAPG